MMIDIYTNRAPRHLAILLAAVGMSGCVQTNVTAGLTDVKESPPTQAENLSDLEALDQILDNGPTAGTESFAASAYGVAASPVIATGTQLPHGGGYQKVGSSYMVKGRRYYPTRTPKKVQVGKASWYGTAFHGRKTANGEIYDMNDFSAAHKTMPLPSYARVTNLKNNRSIIVRVNDRGPFSNNRIMDLSKHAAQVLGYTNAGTAAVKVEYIGPAPLNENDNAYLLSSARGVPKQLYPELGLPISTNITSAKKKPLIVNSYAELEEPNRMSQDFDTLIVKK